MEQHAARRVRAFIVWEPVLTTDWSAPSTANLRRVSDTRAQQFWDKGRLLSRAMGETSRRTIVWDRVLVYPAGVTWSSGGPPEPAFNKGPVVRIEAEFGAAVRQAVTSTRQ